MCLAAVLASAEMELLGAGASFPYPLYSKMFDVYNKEYNVKVNYQSIGSGGGQRQLIDKIIDFGGTDAFLTNEQLMQAEGDILHIPTCIGAVSLTYNLPGNPKIKFTPDLIASIFMGKVKKWNDAKVKEINVGVNLPDLPILVIHRSDGSGTTSIFTDYLAKVSKSWASDVGTGKSVNWPVGLGGKGNEGVAGLVKNTKGSIGYVELIYAEQNKMLVGPIKNKKGNFIEPSMDSASIAANVPLPDDTRASITDTDSEQGYPISGFTWIIVYKEQKYGKRTKEKATALTKLFWWMTHEGQKYVAPLQYAPLPKEAVAKAEVIIKSMKYGGKALM
ncbi:MAG: phosphate ABC transporter substrate-binding protein PstS [Candidatus Fischerbacteria bacterium RBG_13_37_8]|uniref:Phosphate-binding protein n=1 Tax=Candidatus Fischerbacteria bacterium RBG_13_37_8 TaxID=1817863 RepID=A0A1F5VXD7_9BACT|nr:MAG: phosphate ABC transporter substrate-binding protein PstS [Candidatus Fischerbacteria bacterium RBG_13_37_8]